MKMPNALILSILAGLQMTVNQTYPDLWWSPIAIAALAAIVKLIQVNMPRASAETARGLAPDGSPVQEHSKFRQWFVG